MRTFYISICFYVLGYFIYNIFGTASNDNWCSFYYMWDKIKDLLLFLCIANCTRNQLMKSLAICAVVLTGLRVVFEVFDIMGAELELMTRIAKSLSFNMIIISIFIIIYIRNGALKP